MKSLHCKLLMANSSLVIGSDAPVPDPAGFKAGVANAPDRRSALHFIGREPASELLDPIEAAWLIRSAHVRHDDSSAGAGDIVHDRGPSGAGQRVRALQAVKLARDTGEADQNIAAAPRHTGVPKKRR